MGKTDGVPRPLGPIRRNPPDQARSAMGTVLSCTRTPLLNRSRQCQKYYDLGLQRAPLGVPWSRLTSDATEEMPQVVWLRCCPDNSNTIWNADFFSVTKETAKWTAKNKKINKREQKPKSKTASDENFEKEG